MSVYARIIALLEESGTPYNAMEHEPVRTSEQAAAVRGTPLGQGAKALVLAAGDSFVMVVISAPERVDFGRVKDHLGTRKPRFATPDEVLAKTDSEPGGVPPFGNLFGLRVLLDRSLTAFERIDFNAGERTRSIDMRCEDYIRIVQPEIVDVAKK